MEDVDKPSTESIAPTVENTDEHTPNPDEQSNSFVSFHSQMSTPFDTMLLAHATNLRTETDNIKLNICTILKVDIDKFANVTANSIKQSSVLNKLTLADGLLSMLNLSEKVCSVVGGRKLPSQSHSQIGSVTANLSRAVSRDNLEPPPNSLLLRIQNSLDELTNTHVTINQDMLSSIKGQLNELQASIDQLESKRSVSTPQYGSTPPITTPGLLGCGFKLNAPPKPQITPLHEIQSLVDHEAKHVSLYKDNFISPEVSTELENFLSKHSSKFDENSESGHGVISFGEVYNYNGGKALKPVSKVFPPVIAALIASIKKQDPESVINQCLVNRYTDQAASLPEHSDDEKSIVYGSNIYTVSVGGTCDVAFRRKSGPPEEIVQTVKGNSLYVMSKQSQNTWTHRIESCEEERELRYSLTFRYITQHNDNVTIICGDSNTRNLHFGSGKRTFGDKLPGKRVENFVIDQIQPEKCIGYQNVFVHCGVNDIKRSGASVDACVKKLMDKIDRICELCPSSRITVSPILPTKMEWLNVRGRQFNKLLFEHLYFVNPRVASLNFSGFCDNFRLREDMGRWNQPDDYIHLGSTGIFTLSRLIIDRVFKSSVDGRKFSQVANAPVPKSRPSLSHFSHGY